MGTYIADFQTFSIGLLLARLVIGLLMAAHGAQKMFGWFGGYGLKATGQLLEQPRFRPGTPFAGAAAISEIVSGLLVHSVSRPNWSRAHDLRHDRSGGHGALGKRNNREKWDRADFALRHRRARACRDRIR